MKFRKTDPGEIDALLGLFAEARGTIAALGIDQWQDGYPFRDTILRDLDTGVSWVAEVDGEIAGTCACIEDGEPTYDVIEDGEWLTGNACRDYLTVHRVAVAVRFRGTGVSRAIMEFAEDQAAKAGLRSVRIDTHEGNRVMRRMLEKNGFSPCGIIHLENGDRRIAYEKRIIRTEDKR
ncbi:MAG: GNAT family N-acetyltransferase [Clostridia bacterium]|nr:GNAT family N-acetyltransferase [Clostridia bacterium]